MLAVVGVIVGFVALASAGAVAGSTGVLVVLATILGVTVVACSWPLVTRLPRRRSRRHAKRTQEAEHAAQQHQDRQARERLHRDKTDRRSRE